MYQGSLALELTIVKRSHGPSRIMKNSAKKLLAHGNSLSLTVFCSISSPVNFGRAFRWRSSGRSSGCSLSLQNRQDCHGIPGSTLAIPSMTQNDFSTSTWTSRADDCPYDGSRNFALCRRKHSALLLWNKVWVFAGSKLTPLSGSLRRSLSRSSR